MRKIAHLLALVVALAPTSAVMANPQHERMRNCNKTAKEQALKGDERRAFMKTCLSGKHEKPASEPEAAVSNEPKKAS
ncbi:PsiF family protein [Nitrogeniibacter aestuarii]|uniref:PsiF family protein n=1 Tax=Nitrogeniibacter aestuarii TaxID=2815343 RepID=UPI001E3DA121|nr:PsiF family protein [Nitrogeniibacter aestuarii]